MTPVVIDTDVISFLFKRDTRSSLYLPHLKNRAWLLAFMSEAEIERWALQAAWGPDRVAKARVLFDRFIRVPSSRDLIYVGASDGGGPQKRKKDGDGGRMDRCHGIAVRRASGHSQSLRLPRRAGVDYHL